MKIFLVDFFDIPSAITICIIRKGGSNVRTNRKIGSYNYAGFIELS